MKDIVLLFDTACIYEIVILIYSTFPADISKQSLNK